ncbi:MAG: hypothetical protein ACPGID_03395 [Rubricella sp.]
MSVLIAAPPESRAHHLTQALGEAGLEIHQAMNERQARTALLTRSFGAVLLDLDLAGGGALGLADLIAIRHPGVPVIPFADRSTDWQPALFDILPNARFPATGDMPFGDVAQSVLHAARRPLRAG